MFTQHSALTVILLTVMNLRHASLSLKLTVCSEWAQGAAKNMSIGLCVVIFILTGRKT